MFAEREELKNHVWIRDFVPTEGFDVSWTEGWYGRGTTSIYPQGESGSPPLLQLPLTLKLPKSGCSRLGKSVGFLDKAWPPQKVLQHETWGLQRPSMVLWACPDDYCHTDRFSEHHIKKLNDRVHDNYVWDCVYGNMLDQRLFQA